MTEQKTWGTVGRELAQKLEGITEETAIKALGETTMQEILNRESTAEGRANALRMVNREVDKKYPRLESEAPLYWHDPRGRESLKKWRHLVFKSLTLSTSDWDEVGNESRQEWKAQQQQKEVELQQQEVKSQVQPASPTLEAMTIDQFQFDGESQQLIQDALSLSGMTLADFTRQALRVYAKTITGKTRKQSEDLATVSTEKLLNDSTYSTHPRRAEELTKRAIRAIAFYNTKIATENADRWMITQSAIASLTGSRQNTIKEIMPKYQTTIDDNNNHPGWGLTPYSNRKPGKKIDEIINISELVRNDLE